MGDVFATDNRERFPSDRKNLSDTPTSLSPLATRPNWRGDLWPKADKN